MPIKSVKGSLIKTGKQEDLTELMMGRFSYVFMKAFRDPILEERKKVRLWIRTPQMTKEHHVGFEAAAWYWHFVDVVWLFLFVSIYWWGGI
jgi:hypothetical protein